jgi:uncharacterized protein
VEQIDGGTRVRAETDLRITGPQARFGRGVMEDVAGRMLGEFAGCLERRVGSAESVAEAPGGDEQPAAGGDALDVGALLSESKVGRYARAAMPLLAALVVVVLLLRRRR